jgi:hypothetical protein
MSTFEPFAIALRLSGVAIDQAALEAELGLSLSRFEPEDAADSHYAQIDLDDDKPVRAILEFAEQAGPKIAALLASRAIGKAVLDIAFDFPEDGEAMSARLPAHMAAAVAVHEIDIEVSVYLTDVEEAED